MNIVKNVLVVIYLIITLVLIILVLIQSKGDEGASETVMGSGSKNFYEKNKGRTREGRMKRTTIILMVLYFVLTIVLGIIYIA